MKLSVLDCDTCLVNECGQELDTLGIERSACSLVVRHDHTDGLALGDYGIGDDRHGQEGISTKGSRKAAHRLHGVAPVSLHNRHLPLCHKPNDALPHPDRVSTDAIRPVPTQDSRHEPPRCAVVEENAAAIELDHVHDVVGYVFEHTVEIEVRDDRLCQLGECG